MTDDIKAASGADPLGMARHDLGCRCWPHVSEQGATEAIIAAATGEYREGLRRVSPTASDSLREAARDLYSIAVSEHGHDETHSADWPSCLPVHIAMNRYRRASTPQEVAR